MNNNETGKLPYDITVPLWYADLTYLQKIVGGKIWEILGQGKKKMSTI